MSGNAQLLTDYLESLYVRWVWTMGPRNNLYIIGGDPMTQLIFFNNFLFEFFFFIRNADSDRINGKYVVGDPLTHLCNQANIPA